MNSVGKTVSKAVALLAALSLASAMAATTAGTKISNTATANFSDAGGTAQPTVTSNTVTTTVTPVPSFTVTDTAGLNSTNQDNVPASLDHANVKPGSQQTFVYNVVNTGNTPEVVDLTAGPRSDTSIAPGTVNTSSSNIFYIIDGNSNGAIDYTDQNGNGKYDFGEPLLNGDKLSSDSAQDSGTTIDTGVVQPGATVKVLVVYNIPAAAARGDKYGVDLIGTAQYDPNYDPSVPSAINANTAVPNAGNTGAQVDNDNFNRSTVYNAADVVGPNGYPNGNAPTTPTYTDPNNNATVITRNGDSQTAAPSATATTTTFIQSITNNGSLDDRFNLYAFALPTGVTSVQFLKADGTAFAGADDTDGDNRPEIAVAAGATATFQVKVTYAQANITTATASITIGSDSVSDNDSLADDTTTDVLSIARVVLGDKSGTGTAATPDKTQTGNPTGVPSATVSIPMVVQNNGGQADTYTLAATVTFPTTAGGTTTAAATYITDPNCDGSGTGGVAVNSATPLVVASGAKACVLAQVVIPANAKAGTTPTFTQTVTSTKTGATDSDINDTITVQTTTNSYAPSKTVNGGITSSNKPGDDLTYVITGGNTNNAVLTKYYISDPINANLTFKSLSAVVQDASNATLATAQAVYSSDGINWYTTPALAGITASFSGTVYVGADTNKDGNLTTADQLMTGQKMSVTLVETIK